jgi:hypothetical protein
MVSIGDDLKKHFPLKADLHGKSYFMHKRFLILSVVSVLSVHPFVPTPYVYMLVFLAWSRGDSLAFQLGIVASTGTFDSRYIVLQELIHHLKRLV